MIEETQRFIFRVHAVQRMFERRVTVDDVRLVLTTGETTEDYPDDTPYPSRLVLGWAGSRPLHAVFAEPKLAREIVVITVYEPDSTRWDSDFTRRRS